MDGGGSTGRANTHLPSQGVDVNFVVDFHGVRHRRRRRHRGRAVTIRRGGRGSRMQRHHGRRYGIQRYGRPVDLVIVAPLSLPPPRPPSSRLPPPRPNAAMALSSSSSAASANARARAARPRVSPRRTYESRIRAGRRRLRVSEQEPTSTRAAATMIAAVVVAQATANGA